MSATEGSTSDAGFTVTLPFTEGAARSARELVAQLLVDEGCPPHLVDDGRLVAHELVTNGVRHGEPGQRAEISFSCRVLTAHVVISVLDQGHLGDVAARHAAVDSLDGRGLAIVGALSERWTVDRTAGTRVEAWLAR